MASGSEDHSIRIWNIEEGTQLRKIIEHVNKVTCVVFSTDGQYLASGSWDCNVKIWKV